MPKKLTMSSEQSFNSVLREIRKSFPAAEHDRVESALNSADFPMAGANLERIQLAILHCAEGNLTSFEKCVEAAELDWRDVLLAAGLAFGNWREVLSDRGIQLDS